VVPLDEICLLFLGLFLGLDEITWENNDVDEFYLPGLFPTSLYVDYAFMTQPENIPSPGKSPRSGDSTVRKLLSIRRPFDFHHICCHGSGIPVDTLGAEIRAWFRGEKGILF
jgi:hypothetical protein